MISKLGIQSSKFGIFVICACINIEVTIRYELVNAAQFGYMTRFELVRLGIIISQEKMMINPIKRKKTSDFIIEELKKMLLNGTLKEGDKLPDQISLAAQLGVSRLSLREAIHTLNMRGVVVQSPKKGTVIAIGDPEKWVLDIQSPFVNDEKATKELIEARSVLEIAISSKINNITKNEIKKLRQIVEKMKIARKEGDQEIYSKFDVDFHLLIINVGRNRYIKNMYLMLTNNLEQCMNETKSAAELVSMDTLRDHEEIVEHLENNETELARECLQRHIYETVEFIDMFYKCNAKV